VTYHFDETFAAAAQAGNAVGARSQLISFSACFMYLSIDSRALWRRGTANVNNKARKQRLVVLTSIEFMLCITSH
jgi:hypothetical protein